MREVAGMGLSRGIQSFISVAGCSSERESPRDKPVASFDDLCTANHAKQPLSKSSGKRVLRNAVTKTKQSPPDRNAWSGRD